MTALSIRNMNMTLARREQEGDIEPLPAGRERSRYWFIERKSKRGDEWVFVRDLFATKKEAAELWVKNFRNRHPRHRLVHKLKY